MNPSSIPNCVTTVTCGIPCWDMNVRWCEGLKRTYAYVHVVPVVFVFDMHDLFPIVHMRTKFLTDYYLCFILDSKNTQTDENVM